MLAIQRVYQKLEVDSLVIYYEDILLYHFMELASQGNDIEQFCRPEIRMMEEYDRKYNASLKESVEMYLESGRNVQQAAKKMNIHKNTLRYRLERAEELFDIDLTDENTCFNLQFSLRMYRMIR
jgi:DNA-binding PucR family transcriptional regulator